MKSIVLLLLTSFTASGQYIKDYYPLINQAELAIVDSNYREALVSYRKAFAAMKEPRGRDYENAAKCAFLIFDEIGGKFYLRKLANYGFSEEYLKNDRQHLLFRPAFDDVTFSEEMKARYDDSVKKQNEEFSQKSQLNGLFAKLNKKVKLQQSKNDSAALDTLNREFSDFLIAKEKAGWILSDRYENYVVLYLLRDETVKFESKKLEKALVAAVDSGYVDPEEAYSVLTTRQYDFLAQSDRLLIQVSVNPFVCEDKESIEPKLEKWLTDKALLGSKTAQKINKIRAGIGYESLEDEFKKRIHSMTCNDEGNFDLRCPRQHTYYPTTCEKTKELLNGMEVYWRNFAFPSSKNLINFSVET